MSFFDTTGAGWRADGRPRDGIDVSEPIGAMERQPHRLRSQHDRPVVALG